ncbi:FAD-binding oxidoreductase [Streptomyces coffeae]|uniref:FAD-binding oxidoreductase n=1 Tax=Streptomyces coffeae TaxID=621382 RepID=A0ABS1NER5_9ACTN|nr:FAD-binding oxidoreductase [Streptomyces coffeae]MBL1098437.1 FAD-binding oxidoreductase [Streptomyces coffeae]
MAATTVAGGAFAGFGGLVHAAPRGTLPDLAWNELARSLDGTLIRPEDDGYREWGHPQNLRYDARRPAGVVVCHTARDVRTAILFAQRTGIHLVARSGGHSYGGYSATRGLLVDLGQLNEVRPDREAGTVTVGAGARNSGIYTALQPHNLAISAGRCPTVGISGLTLGGGFGFSSRKLGLTADALERTTVVTAAGNSLVCDDRQHPDLFWACRGGGGGNFGINTEFTFRTTPVDTVAVYQLDWDWQDTPAAFAAVQALVTQAPSAFSCRIGGGSAGRTRPEIDGARKVSAIGQFFGTADDLRDLLAPVLRAARPERTLIENQTFWQAKDFLYHSVPSDRYAVTSRYLDRPLPERGVAAFMEAIDAWPGSSNPDGAGIALFAWGGAIAEVGPRETAFIHRTACFLLASETTWAVQDDAALVTANLRWLQELSRTLDTYGNGQAYQNFIDPDLRDWRRAYYGADYPRLTQVKRTYDPENFFHFAQSITG